MDILSIASAAATFLSPYIPVLFPVKKFAEGAAQEIGKQTGGAAFKYVSDLWKKLFPKTEKHKEELTQISTDLGNHDNYQEGDKAAVLTNAQDKLKSLIEQVLKDNPQLQEEIQPLVEKAQQAYSLNIGQQIATKIVNNTYVVSQTINM